MEKEYNVGRGIHALSVDIFMVENRVRGARENGIPGSVPDKYMSQVLETCEDMHQQIGKISEAIGLEAAHDLLMEVTGLLEEHPDGWEGDCNCQTCIDAGDG